MIGITVLLFKDFKFHPGLNVSVRRGGIEPDKVLNAGDAVVLSEVGCAKYQSRSMDAMVEFIWSGRLHSLPLSYLGFEHDERARTFEGLLEVMREIYGEIDITDIVTVVGFIPRLGSGGRVMSGPYAHSTEVALLRLAQDYEAKLARKNRDADYVEHLLAKRRAASLVISNLKRQVKALERRVKTEADEAATLGLVVADQRAQLAKNVMDPDVQNTIIRQVFEVKDRYGIGPLRYDEAIPLLLRKLDHTISSSDVESDEKRAAGQRLVNCMREDPEAQFSDGIFTYDAAVDYIRFLRRQVADLAMHRGKRVHTLINTTPVRPTLDEYFMNMARVAATRSTCRHWQVGAVAVQDKQIISTGYNGAPSGMPHCIDGECTKPEHGAGMECCQAVHAEMNVICQAARWGTPLQGATLYTTHSPCVLCAREIVNAGIRKVVYDQEYTAGFDDAMKILKAGCVEVARLNAEV